MRSSNQASRRDSRKPKDAYAIRTALGWGLIGATIPNQETETDYSAASADCYRITTTEIGLEETPVHSFVQQVHYKEVMNPFAVKKMFELDFSEREGYEKPMSQEDRRFIQRTKYGIHLTEDHHYEISLRTLI